MMDVRIEYDLAIAAAEHDFAQQIEFGKRMDRYWSKRRIKQIVDQFKFLGEDLRYEEYTDPNNYIYPARHVSLKSKEEFLGSFCATQDTFEAATMKIINYNAYICAKKKVRELANVVPYS